MTYSFDKLCDSERLRQEIQDSAITIALDYITTVSSPENTTVYFKAELSEGEEDVLAAIIAAHVNEPLPENVVQDVKLVEDTATPKDSDGSPLQRQKITTTGWNYQRHCFEFETSKLNAVYSKKHDGTDINFITTKFYNSEGTELTTQEAVDSACVMTQLDWMPTHDYEILGGELRQKVAPTEDIRAWVIGLPDIPSIYGGNKEFIEGGANLSYLGTSQALNSDGRAPKYLPYTQNNTNKLRCILKHPAGFKHKIHMIFELFKE